MNLGSVAGAGIAAHLHQHVVPRWGGDTNFMPVIAHTRVLPQLLADTRKLLADNWPPALPNWTLPNCAGPSGAADGQASAAEPVVVVPAGDACPGGMPVPGAVARSAWVPWWR